jgi:hypothetical protein
MDDATRRRDVRLAYIISAYRRPALVLRLVRRLDHEGTTFMIHVDSRSEPGVFQTIRDALAASPNVHLLERHPCRWGDFGHVRASLKGIARLLDSDIPFDRAVLLTGQDYPIKTNEYIHAFFARNRGTSFMVHFPLPTSEWTGGGMERLERWHVRFRGRHRVIPLRRKVPGGLRPFGGSSYWCLTREAVEHVHGFVLANRRFVRFFEHVDVPDELFFQTILMNSPLASTIVNDDLRFIEWKDPDAGSPSVLRTDDLPALARSDRLYARKFDEDVDVEILDRIDAELLAPHAGRIHVE